MSRLLRNILTIILPAMLTVAGTLPASSATASNKGMTIVLDAGHGGNDPGATGTSAKEKDINLNVTQRVAEHLKKKARNVKIIMTRSGDTFIPLLDRCKIANKADADLFVSIHCDSSDNNPNAFGATVFTPIHKRNLATAATRKGKGSDSEDTDTVPSVWLSETDPIVKKSLTGSEKAAGLILKELTSTAGRESRGIKRRDLLVLEFTQMPSVLVELDFICNSDREEFLNSEDGQEKLADAISSALAAYAKSVNSNVTTTKKSTTSAKATEQSVRKSKTDKTQGANNKASKDSIKAADKSKTAKAGNTPTKKEQSKQKTKVGDTVYKIQFLTSASKLKNNDPRLKSLEPVDFYEEKSIYKYTFGETTSISEANKILAEVRKLFPDAFIITTKDGVRIK